VPGCVAASAQPGRLQAAPCPAGWSTLPSAYRALAPPARISEPATTEIAAFEGGPILTVTSVSRWSR
jgi:hypothetical protein